MAFPLPPQHRVDATPVYIDIDDDAWDLPRIEAERAEVERINDERKAKAEKEAEPSGEYVEPDLLDWSEHPVFAYHDTLTRYDLDAPTFWRGQQLTAADYLSGTPTRFVLRRLSWNDYYRVRSMLAQDATQGWVLACKIGLAAIEGDTKIRIDPDLSERSHAEMQTLFEVNPDLVLRIGMAVWKASQPLTRIEKKVSVSSPGQTHPPVAKTV